MSETPHNLIEVIEFCREHGFDNAEVVGRWVWLSFPDKPSKEIRKELKAFGFRWINKRQRWAHNCGHYCRAGQGDPRYKYGAVPVGEINLDEQTKVA